MRRPSSNPFKNNAGESNDGHFLRVSGDCICLICGGKYYDHPNDMEQLDWQGSPFLNVLCDGTRVKL
jgi:hypothetical protein